MHNNIIMNSGISLNCNRKINTIQQFCHNRRFKSERYFEGRTMGALRTNVLFDPQQSPVSPKFEFQYNENDMLATKSLISKSRSINKRRRPLNYFSPLARQADAN